MLHLPPSRRSARAFLRQIGHARSLDAGRIPAALIDWRVAFDRCTDTLRNERAMVRALADWQRGTLRPGVTLAAAELRRIEQPALLVHGSVDPTGSIAALRPIVDALPHGELQIVEGAGHVLWLDDPAAVAGCDRVRSSSHDAHGGSSRAGVEAAGLVDRGGSGANRPLPRAWLSRHRRAGGSAACPARGPPTRHRLRAWRPGPLLRTALRVHGQRHRYHRAVRRRGEQTHRAARYDRPGRRRAGRRPAAAL